MKDQTLQQQKNVLFNKYFSYIMTVGSIGEGNRSTSTWRKRWTDLSQVTDKLYHVASRTSHHSWVRFKFIVFDATFNNISVILLQSVLLVELQF